MTVVSWNQVLLYPKGWAADQITYTASLRLPASWKFGSPLPVASQNGEDIQFKPVSLYTLVDSPVIAGEYLKIVPLSPAGEYPPHEMDIAGIRLYGWGGAATAGAGVVSAARRRIARNSAGVRTATVSALR